MQKLLFPLLSLFACTALALPILTTSAGHWAGTLAAYAEDNSAVLRKLVFPKEFSLGKIYVDNVIIPQWGPRAAGTIVHEKGSYQGEARGTITLKLARTADLYLFPSYDLISHPEILDTIAPNIFDCITFTKMSLMVPIDKTIPALSRLTGLRRLEFPEADLNDSQVAPLKTLTKLEGLNFSTNSISGTCLKELAPLTNLKDLDLTFDPLSPSAYPYLAKFKNLQSLNLSRCGATDSALVEVTKLQNLLSLRIDKSTISVKGLALIKNLKHLRILNLTGTPLSASDLTVLRDLPLYSLGLPADEYSAADWKLLKKTFPKTRLTVKGTQVDADSAKIWAPFH